MTTLEKAEDLAKWLETDAYSSTMEDRRRRAAIIRSLSAELKELREKASDAEYYKWRLTEIMPLFEEARDALPAISLTAAKLRNLDLTLADRMDAAGTRNREQFNLQKRLEQKP